VRDTSLAEELTGGVSVADSQHAPIPGILSLASAFSFNETLTRVQQAIQEKGLTVFARIDHSVEAELAGLSMQPASTLIFGAPKAGTPLMVASPLIALELPLRALVWQDSVGGVLVSYTDPVFLAERFAIPDELRANIAGVSALIEHALKD
jgi:uncharacterized protein (DUF302 family)